MSDPVAMARTARESLSQGLNALQSDPSLPPELLELAAPIAQSMGALHQIERSQGAQVMPHAEVALNHMRAALAQLQAQPSQLPALSRAMEAVASSLSLVHALCTFAQPAPPPAAKPAVAAPAPSFPQNPPAAGEPARVSPMAATAVAAGVAAPVGLPLPGGADVPMITADLGAHSPTNFYKGLSGNDIIDHGGLFVSTYKIPKIGAQVRLHVSLPGGYEFDANAVVRWSREVSDGDDALPGFGAQFTQITPEARQLVYRYVRNREPLFHDDL